MISLTSSKTSRTSWLAQVFSHIETQAFWLRIHPRFKQLFSQELVRNLLWLLYSNIFLHSLLTVSITKTVKNWRIYSVCSLKTNTCNPKPHHTKAPFNLLFNGSPPDLKGTAHAYKLTISEYFWIGLIQYTAKIENLKFAWKSCVSCIFNGIS